MKKTIIALLTVMLNIISLSGQSRTEIYDYFMVPKEFEYNYTDEDGYTSTRRFTVKSASLNFKNDELVGFTLKSDGKAQASFKVYKWINNTSQIKSFFIDKNFTVSIVDWTAIEDGLSITFRYNGYATFGAYFKKRLTAEEKRIREEQERARIAKEKADSIAAVEKAKADSLTAIGRIKESVEKIDSNSIRVSVKNYAEEYYRKNTTSLRLSLTFKNRNSLPIFSSYIEKEHKIFLYIDEDGTQILKIDDKSFPMWNSSVFKNAKEYGFDGIAYKVYDNGFAYETEATSRLYAGYSNGIIMQKKKGNVTYKGVTGDYADKEIKKEEIPSLVASKLQELIKTDGKYRVEYVFAEDRILSLSITKGKKLVYRQTYDSGGHLQKTGTLLTNPK